MILLEILFIILLSLELYDLWKKGLRQTCLKLAVISIVPIIINLIMAIQATVAPYSAIRYFISFAQKNLILLLLWYAINITYYFIIGEYMFRFLKRRKQKRLYFACFMILTFIKALYFIFILFHNIMPWILLVGIIFLCGLSIKTLVQKKALLMIPVLILLLLPTFYFYGTTEGAARLNIIMMGYPIEAFQTGFEELPYLKEKGQIKIYPIKDIKIENGTIGIINVKTILGIKVANHIGF